MHRTRLLILAFALAPSAACSGSEPGPSRYPPGYAVPLLSEPAHLGDNRAGSQNFPTGAATAARLCALVNLPATADTYLQAINLRNSETLSNQLTVNGKALILGITLERDPHGVTPISTVTSPVFPVRLEAGPSEICLVAGRKSDGDVDDFEIDQVMLFVDEIDPESITVRRGLGLGAPPPSYPPSRPWGANQ